MVEFGTHVQPPYDSLAATELAKFEWLRTTLRLDNMDYVNRLAAAGHKILGVLDRDSFPYGWDKQSVRDAVSFYSQCQLAALEVGNEPDLDSPSSWTMDREEWEQLLHDVWDVTWLDGPPLIGGGLAGGDPEYVRGLNLIPLAGLGIHPYGRTPPGWAGPNWGIGTLVDLVENYQAVTGLPQWFTEFGASHHDIGRLWQGHYIRMMARASRKLGITTVIQFCLSDGMVDGYGLYRADMRPKWAARNYLWFLQEWER